MTATLIEFLSAARAQRVEVKLQRAQTFFGSLTAEEIELLRADPQIAQHMLMLARELQTLASAVGPELVNIEDEERQIA